MPAGIGEYGCTYRVEMATTADALRGESRTRPGVRKQSESGEEPVVSRSEGVPEGLDLLADDYARSLLSALAAGPSRGRDLVAECEGSRATVYRRLDRLVEAGLVRTETTLDPDGHHCKEFRLARESLTVTVEDGALTVTAGR